MENLFILLFSGLFVLILGICFIVTYIHEQKNPYEIVNGKIIDLEKQVHYSRTQTGGAYIGFVPIFEYTYNGNIYKDEHRVSSAKYSKGMKTVSNSKYKVGDTVEIRVYEGKKIKAIINDEKNIKLPLYIGIGITMLGLVLSGAAIYLLINYK